MSISGSSQIGQKPGVCTSTTRPTSPYAGQMIFETDTYSVRIYDGSSWVGTPPSGTLQTFAGSTIPNGWLLCYGQAISRTGIYADLYAALGTVYGTGDGSTTFNLPDLRGRVPAGKDNMGGSAASRLTSTYFGGTATNLGATGGLESHQLTSAQMPSHAHAQNLPTSTTGTTPNNPGAYFNSNTFYTNSGTGYTSFSGANVSSAGGDGSHNNTQPTIILNYIIKV